MVHELFPFDPNTASAEDFERLGLESWQARSIIRFREKGGIFSRPSDFARVYGITKKTYEVLLPFIQIADDYKPAADFYGKKDMEEAEGAIHLIIIIEETMIPRFIVIHIN